MATAKIVLEVSTTEYILIQAAMNEAQGYMKAQGGYWPPLTHIEALQLRFDLMPNHESLEFSLEEGVALSWAIGYSWRLHHHLAIGPEWQQDARMEVYKQLPTDGE